MKELKMAAVLAATALALGACSTPSVDGAAPPKAPAQTAADDLGTSWELAKMVAEGYVTTCTLAPTFSACQTVVVDVARKALTVGEADVAAAQQAILVAGSDAKTLEKAVAIGKQAIAAFEQTVVGLGLGASSSSGSSSLDAAN